MNSQETIIRHLLLMLLLVLASCATTHREQVQDELASAAAEVQISQELATQFSASQLSSEEIAAFEKRAIQKLEDFSAYLQLLSKQELDTVFRQKIMQQTLALFAHDEVSIYTKGKQMNIKTLLEAIAFKDGHEYNFEVRNIQFYQRLYASETQNYQGTLSFDQVLPTQSTPERRNIEILVKKKFKQFGKEKEWVWEVFLSDIE